MFDLLENPPEADFWFPYAANAHGFKEMNMEYFPLIRVPGFVWITKQKSPGVYARTLAWSVFQCWPLVAINVCMALVAGIMMWYMVS